MYALVFVGVPPLLRARRGRMCIAKRYNKCIGVPLGSLFFTWLAWDKVPWQGTLARDQRYALVSLGAPSFLVHCQGIFMYALASLEVPFFFRDRFGTMCTAKGCDITTGVPCGFVSFAWQAWIHERCQEI